MKLDHSVQHFNFYLQKFKLKFFWDRLTGLSSIHDWGICVPKQGRRRSKSSAGLLLRAFDIALHVVIYVSSLSLFLPLFLYQLVEAAGSSLVRPLFLYPVLRFLPGTKKPLFYTDHFLVQQTVNLNCWSAFVHS